MGELVGLKASDLREFGRTGRILVEGKNGANLIPVAEQADLTERLHPHLFRHSFATEALRAGMGPVQLQNIPRHGSLAMISRVYAHLNTDDAERALERMLLAR